ncbi:tRNA (adenosine(37)-N6)-threonylcarbamoyltransferase complex dimerization subunit type 1 TsaB [Piscinibacter sp.]|uniref:tRNA (adenosine(37)-N6)-threonylcarbamoyltransferase complex dimerization subunit type 1 TsaB n=1 Tax=Piscinibacter sp. TaxID=1903157 RepID=UPI003559930D
MTTLLAFDTATEHMSIALGARGEVWVHEAAGGAQASASLIPSIMALLSGAGVSLRELDAIAFGRGPGAFTGLRTACSVAQGLAFGAGKPVLPIDTLLTVAEDARIARTPHSVWVVMDARMNEIYAAHYAFDGERWQTLAPPLLTSAVALNERWRCEAADVVAGTALGVFGEQLDTGSARRAPQALPHARAMLPLARSLWEQGGAVDAALALPLYVRDKVAQTTAEREALRMAGAA